MPSFPPFRAIRPHLPLLGVAVVLTQVPAVALMLVDGRPIGAGLLAYSFASLGAAGGLFAVAFAFRLRVERIVALVRGYADHGHLPDLAGEGRSVEHVQASLANLDRLVRGLEADAVCDPLTGIANRRACVSRLETDLTRSQRSTAAFSIVLFDLDNLKAINDRHGHGAGDLAIRRLAQALQEATREGDWAGRWGGDEFVVGLWGADRSAAIEAGERILARLRAEPLRFDDVSLTLGASAGAAQSTREDDAVRLFERADEALLEAKRLGRGRLSVR